MKRQQQQQNSSLTNRSKIKRKKTKVHEDEVQENRMSGMDSNPSQNTEESQGEGHNDNDQMDKRKGRGATKFRVATLGQKPHELKRNEYGQPVGKVSKKYSSFLGCLTKEFVSYTFKGWEFLDGEVKNRMWECLQKKTRKPGDTPITRVQVWVQGHINKDGQPSNQAVAEKMNEIQQCPLESQTTTTIDDDALSLVLGKEARGRVRGMGFGVTPSKVGAQIQNNVVVNQLQDEVRCLKEKFDELSSILLAQAQNQQPRQEQNASGGGIRNAINGDGVNDATPQSNRAIRENMKCKLLHPSNGGVVAEGRIASTYPKAKVHHIAVGEYFWKVWVDKVIAEDVALIRPNDEMTHLKHARGSTVAWLSAFIILDD